MLLLKLTTTIHSPEALHRLLAVLHLIHQAVRKVIPAPQDPEVLQEVPRIRPPPLRMISRRRRSHQLKTVTCVFSRHVQLKCVNMNFRFIFRNQRQRGKKKSGQDIADGIGEGSTEEYRT